MRSVQYKTMERLNEYVVLDGALVLPEVEETLLPQPKQEQTHVHSPVLIRRRPMQLIVNARCANSADSTQST